MNHLKSYNDYSVNEKLTRTQRVWLNLPIFLFALLGKLVGIYPLLNLRWKEIKKKTNDSEFDPIFATSGSSPNEMKDELTEISLGDIKASKVKIPMILRGWKIYSSDRETHDKRKIVYLTKDTIKKGDRYTGERLSDRDVYPESAFTYKTNQYIDKGKKRDFKIKDGYPCIILIAKFDKEEKTKEISQYIDDICLDLEDEFPISAEPGGNPQSDKFWISIEVNEGYKLVFDNNLDNKINDISNRILNYLKTEGKSGYKSTVGYRIKGPLYYFGEKGKYKSLADPAYTYTTNYSQDSEYAGPYFRFGVNRLVRNMPNHVPKSLLTNDGKYQGIFNIPILSRIGVTYINGKKVNMRITGEDVKTLLSDLDNCKKSYNTFGEKYKVDEIYIDSISINITKE